MQRLLGAITVLIGLTIPSSAAAVSPATAETGSLLLIGTGLILGATFTRVRTARKQ